MHQRPCQRAFCFAGNLLKGYMEEETWPDLHLKFPLDNDGCRKSLETKRLGDGSERGDEEMKTLSIRIWR